MNLIPLSEPNETQPKREDEINPPREPLPTKNRSSEFGDWDNDSDYQKPAAA